MAYSFEPAGCDSVDAGGPVGGLDVGGLDVGGLDVAGAGQGLGTARADAS